MAWINSEVDTVQAIGKKAPNKNGVYDIIGNACEWTEDGVNMGGDYKSKLSEALSANEMNRRRAGVRLLRSPGGV